MATPVYVQGIQILLTQLHVTQFVSGNVFTFFVYGHNNSKRYGWICKISKVNVDLYSALS